MMDWAIGNLQILVPVALFTIFATVEWFRPRRPLILGRGRRWITHLSFFGVNALVGRALSFIIIVSIAANWAENHNFGLFHLVNWPWWVDILVAFIAMDFAVWLQHVLMHKIPLLWRAHIVHHSDRDLDVTTALRFHPLELILSTLYKSAWVVLLGVPAAIIIAFEIWLNGNAMFNHGNINLPPWLDRIVRPFLVTPDMHLVHHSIDIGEQNHNYGFALTLWDRLARTYRAESRFGRDQQPIGLTQAQNEQPRQLGWSLLLPFRDVN